MRILVVGNGAREHAIVWKLCQSPNVTALFVAPGNAGIAQLAENVSILPTDIKELIFFAQKEHVDFTVIGPEAPLAAGIVDRFQEAGLQVFGPNKNAAMIESSKVFAKELMLCHGVPTAAAKTFASYTEAREYVQSATLPVVVKADGLAAGKGVVVARTHEAAIDALRRQMKEKEFGIAGERVLIEEHLEGREVSVFAFVDGERVSPMVAAYDYKQVGDGDTGPNTGGMGSFSTPQFWTEALEHRIRTEIMEPVTRAMAARGTPYRGVLYGGLMLTANGPKVLEFNCRLGDPEAQVILPRLKTDLVDIMIRTVQGRLYGASIEWAQSSCVGVVVASGGYPGHYATGYPIEGLDGLDDDVMVFHAGTRVTDREGERTVTTSGGRVLTVASLGKTVYEARRKAYLNVKRIQFKDSFYRKDIAAVG